MEERGPLSGSPRGAVPPVEACGLARRLLEVGETEVTTMPNNVPNAAMPSPGKSPLAHTVHPPKRSSSGNEGEGSRSAGRNYDEATEKYVKSGRVEEAAKNAEAAVDGQEGEELRAAEQAARGVEPGEDDRPTRPMRRSQPGGPPEPEEGLKEPELMKDESEDRE